MLPTVFILLVQFILSVLLYYNNVLPLTTAKYTKKLVQTNIWTGFRFDLTGLISHLKCIGQDSLCCETGCKDKIRFAATLLRTRFVLKLNLVFECQLQWDKIFLIHKFTTTV